MRFTCLRWLAYALALGVPALAQPPTRAGRIAAGRRRPPISAVAGTARADIALDVRRRRGVRDLI